MNNTEGESAKTVASDAVVFFVVRCYGDTRTQMEAYALAKAHEWAESDALDIHIGPRYEVLRCFQESRGKYWADIIVHICPEINIPEFMVADSDLAEVISVLKKAK